MSDIESCWNFHLGEGKLDIHNLIKQGVNERKRMLLETPKPGYRFVVHEEKLEPTRAYIDAGGNKPTTATPYV